MLERKLCFLQQVMGKEVGGLSARVREAFCDEVSSLCLVRECEELEEALMTTHTGSILRGEAVETREIKEEIRKKDRQQSFSRCDEKSPLIAQVAGEVGWGRLWDACLSLGEKYTFNWVEEAEQTDEPRWQRTAPVSIV